MSIKLHITMSLTLQEVDEGSVRLLGLEASVEKERVLTGPPGLGIRDTPRKIQSVQWIILETVLNSHTRQ